MPAGGIIAIIIVLYAVINVAAVKWFVPYTQVRLETSERSLTIHRYGETEFWAALGKMLLIIGLILYTFITMLGGNPLGDRYGFR